MSSWWPATSGRYSPFTSFYSRATGPPKVHEDDYSYIAAADLADADGRDVGGASAAGSRSARHDSYGFPSKSAQQHSANTSPRLQDDSLDLGPDILLLKYKGATYPLHFPAFSISDARLKVRDVRQLAARELRVSDPRRIRLLYKGRQLRDDQENCKREKLKQNSEVSCVVQSEPISAANDDDDDSFDSGAGDSNISSSEYDRRRGDSGSAENERTKRKNHRAGNRKKSSTKKSDNGLLSPHLGGGGGSSDTSRSQTQSPSHPTPSKAPPLKPATPLEALNNLNATFTSTLLPQIETYLSSPPHEPRAREQEYKKLSEGVLQQILLNLDGVDTGGDEGLRMKRKEIVKGVQNWLGKLDEVGKGH